MRFFRFGYFPISWFYLFHRRLPILYFQVLGHYLDYFVYFPDFLAPGDDREPEGLYTILNCSLIAAFIPNLIVQEPTYHVHFILINSLYFFRGIWTQIDDILLIEPLTAKQILFDEVCISLLIETCPH